MSGKVRRREPTLLAAFAVLATIILLVIRGSGLGGKTAQPEVAIELMDGAPRHLQVVVDSPLETYATVHLVTPERSIRRLFPPLGTPRGIPWPLPAHETVRLFPDDGLVAPLEMAGFVVVRLVADPVQELEIDESVPLETGALERRLDAYVFELEPSR